ncbi:MAG: DUF421 domain-containing protein [Elusimicrobia bacterium]|nr:DUF421 domain-containing protein [Elusimicrobiota bacterium]
MWQQLLQPSVPAGQLVIRAVVVYFSILLLLRLAGKRQVGQMGVGEFVAILLISNAVQNAMNGGDNSLGGGLLLAVVLLALSVAVSYLTYRSKGIENLLQGRPTLLIHDGQIISKNLHREQLNAHELRVILRRQGIHDLHEIHEAVLESDGFVSVIKKSELSRQESA